MWPANLIVKLILFLILSKLSRLFLSVGMSAVVFYAFLLAEFYYVQVDTHRRVGILQTYFAPIKNLYH